jgi:hypothetical protein
LKRDLKRFGNIRNSIIMAKKTRTKGIEVQKSRSGGGKPIVSKHYKRY